MSDFSLAFIVKKPNKVDLCPPVLICAPTVSGSYYILYPYYKLVLQGFSLKQETETTYPMMNFILPLRAVSTRIGTSCGSRGPKMP